MPALEKSHQELSQKDILFARESTATAHPKGGRRKEALRLQINGIAVPPGSYLNKLVGTCLEWIAEGHPVAVIPVEDEIGTQEAADMLKVSRPFMVKLLDSKALPSRKVGVQRRVADLAAAARRLAVVVPVRARFGQHRLGHWQFADPIEHHVDAQRGRVAHCGHQWRRTDRP